MEARYMTYKEALTAQMEVFAKDERAVFVGYGLLGGKGANGTMKNIPDSKICEVTVAENLMAGMAMGMALTGKLSLLFLERSDFIWNAADCIVNHLDQAKNISRGEWNPCVVIRVVVGNKLKPLFTGPTHVGNSAPAMRAILKMPVYEVRTPEEVTAAYERAFMEQREGIGSSMIYEMKDLL